MKKSLRVFVAVMIVALGATGFSAAAQLRFGPKVGVCINSIKFNDLGANFESDNRAGFTGGLMAEFTVPVIGLGADASVLYVRRSQQWMDSNDFVTNRDYIDIPVNLKWKISNPVGKIVTPYIITGPDFAFLCSKKTVNNIVEGNSFDFSWNVGLGVQLFDHLQVQANYGIGLSKAVKFVDSNYQNAGIEGKNNYWTITAAYLF